MDLEGLSKFRDDCIWISAEIIAERAFSSILVVYAGRGESLGEVKEHLKSLLDGRLCLRDFVGHEEHSVSGATNSERELLFDEYIPALLKGKIEFLEDFVESQPAANEEVSAGIIETRRRMIGFIQEEMS